MKVELCKHQKIVPVARDEAALLAGSLVKHVLILSAEKTELSDVDRVDSVCSQVRSDCLT